MAGRGKPPAPPGNVRRRKRSQPPVFSSASSASCHDKDNDYVCPICFEMIEEAHMVKCGHSFCHHCIMQSLTYNQKCPRCGFLVDNREDVFPNLTLNELILKEKQKLTQNKKMKLTADFTATEALELLGNGNLDYSQVSFLMDVLAKQRDKLEGETMYAQYQLLQDFLTKVHEKKVKELEELHSQVALIESDQRTVQQRLDERCHGNGGFVGAPVPEQEETLAEFPLATEQPSSSRVAASSTVMTQAATAAPQDGFNGSKNGAGSGWLASSLASRRRKMHCHFDELETSYLDTRRAGGTAGLLGETDTDYGGPEALEVFKENLDKFTQFTAFRNLATLSYANDIYNNSSIVSSIEFDRDCDFFAIAGVTKKIKVFEYSSVILEHIDLHYPVHEMLCSSKISSVVWSQYHKNLLASSDYEGTVTLWDVYNGAKSRVFQEHEKRCWSVDFNRQDPKLLASGSDDSRVKLWYTNMQHSVACIEAKANVCCVKFSNDSRYHIAFGSADHCVHYYDLRSTRQPLQIFKGHKKAVSYAKFVSTNQIVSASTDSQLKLWDLTRPPPACLRTFRGHSNEKNFVGLATDGDYIACGSENNSLYLYYRGLSKHLVTYKFDTIKNVLERGGGDRKEDDTSEFVSAVCWRPGSNVVVAANSQGIIKVLELT